MTPAATELRRAQYAAWAALLDTVLATPEEPSTDRSDEAGTGF